MKKPVPEKIDLTEEEANKLLERVAASNLSNDDQKLIVGVLNFCLWLQIKLTNAKITIRKLSKIFGISSEKRSNKHEENDPPSTDQTTLCYQDKQISTDNKLDVNDDEQQQDESNKKKGKK